MKKKPWFEKNPGFFSKEKFLLKKEFPALEYQKNKGQIFIKGNLIINIKYEGKSIKDEFKINIAFPDDYPKQAPLVFEVGGRKERILKNKQINLNDLHFNPDGSACLTVNVKKYLPKQKTISYFLNYLVIYFFAGLSYYEKNGAWLFGEYSHGDRGVLEFYQETTSLIDLDKIISIVEFLANNKQSPIEDVLKVDNKLSAEILSTLEEIRKYNGELKNHLIRLKKLKTERDNSIRQTVLELIKEKEKTR